MMNRDVGYAIGAKLGEVLDVDARADGGATGKYLRFKVRLDIQTLLMRGFTLEEDDREGEMEKEHNIKEGDEEENRNWCPFEYEYLPDFCYICGIIGHVDRTCTRKLKKGEKPQFGPWLRAFIDKRQKSDNNRG